MDTSDMEVLTSGVLIEFCDGLGNTVGTAVHEWNGKPLPAVGDSIGCYLPQPSHDGRRQLRGTVRARQFDVQHDEQGQACVWVRLVVRVDSRPARRRTPRRVRSFSRN